MSHVQIMTTIAVTVNHEVLIHKSCTFSEASQEADIVNACEAMEMLHHLLHMH